MSQTVTPAPVINWARANQAYLDGHLRRLRLLLQRRVLWLRRQWQNDPLEDYKGMVISDAQANWMLAGEDRQAEARFYREDPEAAEISQAIVDLTHRLAEQQQELTEAGTPPALEVLTHLFDLAPFDRDVLLLCLAPELDSTIERLYAYVQDEVNRKYVTPHLALTLFAGPPASLVEEEVDGVYRSARHCLLPESPLRRFRLVTLESGQQRATALGARPLCLDDRIANYLQGVNRLDERVVPLLRPMPPALIGPPQRDLIDRIARRFENIEKGGRWPVVNLTGSGKRAVAQGLCADLNLELFHLDVRRLPAPGPDRQEMLRLLEREAVLLGIALYLDATEIDRRDEVIVASLDDVIERLDAFLLLGSRQRWESERYMVTVKVPKPDANAQRVLWQQALEGEEHLLNGQLDAVVQQFDFGPRTIAQAVKAAHGKAELRATEENATLSPDDLWQACREQAGWHLDELAQRIIPCYSWQDIVLPEDVFAQLQEIAAQVANRPQVYEAWGFGSRLSRGLGISALFSGPSGTGKTMAAEIMADQLKLDLYRIDLAGMVSKYIGETEKNLRKVFDAAEQSGAILFFDEADALFGKRTEVKDSHDRYANIEVNYLLQRMEDFRGLAILATNRKSDLDTAFLRRLRFLVDFPFPAADSRRRIWQKSIPPQAPSDGIGYDVLARLEIPGGNIRNIALNAAFLAAGQGVPIGMTHLVHAARREYAKIDKLISETEFGSYSRLVKS